MKYYRVARRGNYSRRRLSKSPGRIYTVRRRGLYGPPSVRRKFVKPPVYVMYNRFSKARRRLDFTGL